MQKFKYLFITFILTAMISVSATAFAQDGSGDIDVDPDRNTPVVDETDGGELDFDLINTADDAEGPCGCKSTFIRTKPH